MSERAGLAQVPRRNHLWIQTSWFHRNVPAWAPQPSYKEQHNRKQRRLMLGTNESYDSVLVFMLPLFSVLYSFFGRCFSVTYPQQQVFGILQYKLSIQMMNKCLAFWEEAVHE